MHISCWWGVAGYSLYFTRYQYEVAHCTSYIFAKKYSYFSYSARLQQNPHFFWCGHFSWSSDCLACLASVSSERIDICISYNKMKGSLSSPTGGNAWTCAKKCRRWTLLRGEQSWATASLDQSNQGWEKKRGSRDLCDGTWGSPQSTRK